VRDEPLKDEIGVAAGRVTERSSRGRRGKETGRRGRK
jgi:hypothetical protein